MANIRRIHELDALRGIAALGVVFWHYGAHFDARPLQVLFFPFYQSGFLLVDFFFVLSGYVIARSYWKESRRGHFAQNVWTRVARLYPLHLLTLLVTALLLGCLPPTPGSDFSANHDDAKHFILNLLLLNNIGFQDGWSFNTPAWSISTEFVINLFFLFFIACGRWVRLAMLVLIGVVLVGMLAAKGMPHVDGQKILGMDVNLLRCALGFGAGVAVYWSVHRWHLDALLSRHRFVATALAVTALCALVALLCVAGAKPHHAIYLVSVLVATAVVLFVPYSRGLPQGLNMRPLTWLGEVSYSVYLTHYPLQLVFHTVAKRFTIDFASPITLTAYVASVLAVSALTYMWVELPAQSWLRARWKNETGLSTPAP